ncbi:hypothetical protein CI109_105473 [Kwoniella shandongensis]|uniref:Uncharacterized protein n=1 Tax=Kwoniella shandongensis TaxID=1734106 RepID=A0A5M6C3G3_9TREE|nr:uncharacterized protein CI109_002194 [Kwoniella shandongensis]KAA5529301.1 hypothetical protein CI109_002194 [Kwoniella shandongensis]
MFSRLTPIITVLVLLRFHQVQADYSPAFAGCINGGAVIDVDETIDNQSDANACARACYATETPRIYSFFKAGYFITDPEPTPRRRRDTNLDRRDQFVPPECLCTDIPVSHEVYEYGTSSQGEGYCSSDQYTSYVTASTFAFDDCYNSFDGDTDYKGAVAGVEGCFSLCKSDERAIIEPIESELTCYCGNFVGDAPVTFSGPGTCGPSNFLVYSHDANSAISSGFVKRQLRERLRISSKKRRATCPAPLTACNVAGVLDAFECINVKEELESCGGCLSGDFNDVHTAPGVDCTALPGIPRGGVTCTAGRCEAFACKKGYQLASNGTCLAL